MIFDFGDVVVVPFPFVDVEVAKHRPALVLTNRQFNTSSGQTVLAMITSAARSTWSTDIQIIDLQSAGLKHVSVVRWKLFTLANDIILSGIGTLSRPDADSVRQALMQHFGPHQPSPRRT